MNETTTGTPYALKDLMAGGKLEVAKGDFAATHDFSIEILEEWGPRLPFGRVVGGAIARDFRMREDTSDLEVALGDVRNRPDLRNAPGDQVTYGLAVCLESLMGTSFTSGKFAASEMEGERVNLVGGLDYVDIVYLMLYRAMGRGLWDRPVPLPAPTRCGQCRAPMTEVRYNLARARIPVWHWKEDQEPRAVAHLSRRFDFADGTDRLVVGPPAWSRAMRGLTDADLKNDARVDQRLAAAAIRCGDDCDERGPLAGMLPQQLGGLLAKDLDLVKEASRIVGGEAVPFVPAICPACGHEVLVPFSWRSVGFF